MLLRPVARPILDWFCLSRWENYCLLAVASLTLLTVVCLRAEGRQAVQAIKAPRLATAVAPREQRPTQAQALAAAPRARETSWVKRHELIKRRAAAQADVLLLGDSITQGWDYKAHWQEHFPDISAVNAGITSDRAEHVLWRVRDGLFHKARPKVVVLLAGINNLALHEPERIAATQAETIRIIRTRSPGTKVLLLGVLPSGGSADHPRRAKIARLNDQLKQLADGDEVQFLDIGNLLLETDGSLAKATAFDSLHLTARGYRIWAEAMSPTLRIMLQASPLNG